MRVTQTVIGIDLTDGPGAVKLFDAYIEYTNPPRVGQLGRRDQPVKLTFTGIDPQNQEHKVTLVLDSKIERISWRNDDQKEFIGYRFWGLVDGDPVEVQYWLKDPGFGRGVIIDRGSSQWLSDFSVV